MVYVVKHVIDFVKAIALCSLQVVIHRVAHCSPSALLGRLLVVSEAGTLHSLIPK